MHACSGNLCPKFRILSFINNWEKSGVLLVGFSSFLVNLSNLADVMLQMNHDRALSLLSWFISACPSNIHHFFALWDWSIKHDGRRNSWNYCWTIAEQLFLRRISLNFLNKTLCVTFISWHVSILWECQGISFKHEPLVIYRNVKITIQGFKCNILITVSTGGLSPLLYSVCEYFRQCNFWQINHYATVYVEG